MMNRPLDWRGNWPWLVGVALLPLAGCPDAANTPGAGKPAAEKPPPLVVLVADDPELGRSIAREWRGRTEEELTVRDVTSQELTAANRLPGDAVLFPSGLIGQLAERALILSLDPAALESPDFNHRDIFDQLRLREMKWGPRTLAAPLGSPQLLLVYRADLFRKLGLSPPTDWAAYQRAAVRLTDRSALGDLAPPADQPWHATLEPLAAGWAGQLLLARAAAFALHRDQVSALFRFEAMTPLIDQPPFVRALDELVAAAKTGEFAEQRLSPPDVFAAMQSGQCAMALTWPPCEKATEISENSRNIDLAFALLPGSPQAYRFGTKTWDARTDEESPHVPLLATSGRMAAVVSSTSDPRRAQTFVLWLAGREVSQQVGPHSQATTLFRGSQVATSTPWTGAIEPAASRQYAEVLAETLRLPRALSSPTLPGRADYLAALDEAVQQALGGKTSKEALLQAAARWQKVTEKIGVEQQRRANARSLGQEDF